MKKIAEKLITVLLIAVVFMSGFSFEVWAAGSSSLSVSDSTINIGDTVSVTLAVNTDSGVVTNLQMRITYDAAILEYQGADDTSCNGGSGVLTYMKDVQGSSSLKITFKAVAPGTASVSASTTAAYIEETMEETSVSGSSASVTVNNAAGGGNTGGSSPGGGGSTGGGGTGGGNTGGTDSPEDNQPEEPKKSGDNSLKSLTISPGSLSPSFKPATTKYTASVGADVTSIAVDAQVSNSKATVESVTGNTNLEMGENQIKIVVKAENGTTATYTITVNRGGATEEPDADPGEPKEPEGPENTPDTGILIDGTAYQISESLPEVELPEEFTKTFATYGDKEVEAYLFPYKNLTLFYLIPVDAEGGENQGNEGNEEGEENSQTGRFFFRNEADNQFFPYINITVGDTYVLALPADFAETPAPQGYQEAIVAIHEESLSGYQLLDGAAESFYLLYGVNRDGIAGWYHYDSADVSLQRYQAPFYITEEAPKPDNSASDEAYKELNARYQKEKSNARLAIVVLIFLLAVSILVIVNILIFKGRGKSGKRRRKSNGDTDYIDFDDF